MPTSNNKELVYNMKIEKNTWNIEYRNNKGKNTYIELPLFYYSGYRIVDISNTTNKLENKDGYVKVNIADESGYLSVKYVGTRLLRIGYIITEITVGYIDIYIIIKYYRYITKKLKNVENVKNSCNL